MKIGVDIDDTLLDFIGTYAIFHNEIYKTNLKKEDFKTYSFNPVGGRTTKQAVNTVKQFYKTDFFKEMQPFPGAVGVLQKLKENNKLFIVTSRPHNMKEETSEWVLKYFPNIFSDIFFSSNHYTKAKNSGRTKAEICCDLEVSLLIDDSLAYAKQCIEKGINVFLFGDNNPWNQNHEEHENITRVKDWNEIMEKLK